MILHLPYPTLFLIYLLKYGAVEDFFTTLSIRYCNIYNHVGNYYNKYIYHICHYLIFLKFSQICNLLKLKSVLILSYKTTRHIFRKNINFQNN